MQAEIDAMHELGIDTIIITYVEYVGNRWGAFYPSSIPELTEFPNFLGFDFVETVMGRADQNDQSVMLGIGRGGDALLTYEGCNAPGRLQRAQSLAERKVRELHAMYAGSHDSFAGWYITHECRDIGFASPYYNFVADLCHELAPGQPVMISPDGSPVAGSEVIADSHVDIFAYQDAVGAGFVPAPNERYSFDPEQRLSTLTEVFEEYADWHAEHPEKQIWANVEIWQMDGPDYTAAYPADWSRVERQIDAVREHVSQVVVYEFGGFMEHTDSDVQLGGPRAIRLFNDYRQSLRAATASSDP